jgi:hypothetical protein
MSSLPSLETAEAMCELWGHPRADDGCACGEMPALVATE